MSETIPRRTLLTRVLSILGVAVSASFLGRPLSAQQRKPAAAPQQKPAAAPQKPCVAETHAWQPTGPSRPSDCRIEHLGPNKATSPSTPAGATIQHLGQNKAGAVAVQKK